MPTISVIVPVYNVERYLAACLDTIRSQTFSDFEVICINDGSLDRSGEILELYSQLDERFRVVKIDNQGVSHARNLGIDLARGSYLCFVDSDDLLVPQTLETVVRTFNESGADMIKYSAEPFPAAFSDPWTNANLMLEDAFFEGYSDELVFDRHARPFPWNGAYRVSFLRENNLHFPEDLALGEDQVFSFATLCRSRATKLLSEKLYRYRMSRNDSLTALAAADKVERLLTHQRVVQAILDDWREMGLMHGESGTRILDFICMFLLFDIFELEDLASRDGLLCSLRELLRSQFSGADISSLSSGEGVRSWLMKVYSYDGSPESFGRRAVYGLTGALYGRKAAFRRIVADVFKQDGHPVQREAAEPADSGENVDDVIARLNLELETRASNNR